MIILKTMAMANENGIWNSMVYCKNCSVLRGESISASCDNFECVDEPEYKHIYSSNEESPKYTFNASNGGAFYGFSGGLWNRDEYTPPVGHESVK